MRIRWVTQILSDVVALWMALSILCAIALAAVAVVLLPIALVSGAIYAMGVI